jgi:hypothetical protein
MGEGAMSAKPYQPFARGIEQGRMKSACDTCGTNPGNSHTLLTSGWCDRLRKKLPFSEEAAEQMERVLKTKGRNRKPKEQAA